MAKKKPQSENTQLALEKVNEAVKGEKYLIAVVKHNPKEEPTFEFFYVQENFPDSEVFSSLQKIATMYKEPKVKITE
jgi:hypothetical protein